MQLWSILPSKAEDRAVVCVCVARARVWVWENLPEHDEHDALDRQQLVERPQRRDDGVRLVVEEDLGITCVEVLHL